MCTFRFFCIFMFFLHFSISVILFFTSFSCFFFALHLLFSSLLFSSLLFSSLLFSSLLFSSLLFSSLLFSPFSIILRRLGGGGVCVGREEEWEREGGRRRVFPIHLCRQGYRPWCDRSSFFPPPCTFAPLASGISLPTSLSATWRVSLVKIQQHWFSVPEGDCQRRRSMAQRTSS